MGSQQLIAAAGGAFLVLRRELRVNLHLCTLAMHQIDARNTTISATVDHQVGPIASHLAQVDASKWRIPPGVVHHDADVHVRAHCNVNARTGAVRVQLVVVQRISESILTHVQRVASAAALVGYVASSRHEYLDVRAVSYAYIWNEIASSTWLAAIIGIRRQWACISVDHNTQDELVVALAFDVRTLLVSSVWWLWSTKKH